MPRKSLPRSFKLVCKHYRGFDRHFATKAIVARKFHASQGVFVNQKLAAAPDCKYGKGTSRPLVRSYSTYATFASQPLAPHARSARHLTSLPHARSAHPQSGPAAPSFAAVPVWSCDHQNPHPAPSTRAPTDSGMEQAPKQSSPPSVSKLRANPLYQYASLSQPQSPVREQGARAGKKQERSGLKWYGSLDRRPINKVTGSLPRSVTHSDQMRMAAAFAAYADLDGPKH